MTVMQVIYTAQKWSFHKGFLLQMSPNPQFPADMVTLTEEIVNGKLHFLCSIMMSFIRKVWFSDLKKSAYSYSLETLCKEQFSFYIYFDYNFIKVWSFKQTASFSLNFITHGFISTWATLNFGLTFHAIHTTGFLLVALALKAGLIAVGQSRFIRVF